MAVVEQENPLVEGLERMPVHPTTLVIFGGTGDLAHRKLLPAIYNLAHEGALPERFNLIAVSRSVMSDDDYRGLARESIKQHSRREPDPQVLEKLLESVRYVPGTFDDDSVFEHLRDELAKVDREVGIAFNRIFYLSTAPSFFSLIVQKLGHHGLVVAADHHAVANLEAPDAAAHAHVHVVHPVLAQVLLAALVVRPAGVAAVDDRVALVEQLGELLDRALRRVAGRNHDPHGPRRLELRDEVL